MADAPRGSGEAGFTIVEVLVAVIVIPMGVLVTIAALDISRRLTSLSERKEAAVHVGQQHLERIQARQFDTIALTSAPTASADPASPRYRVVDGSPARYRWNVAQDQSEPFAVDPVKGLDPAPVPWQDGRLHGELHHFVTLVDDPSCGALCPGDADYKRITVAVTVQGPGAPRRPIFLSSLVQDPDAGPIEGVADGISNVLQAPETECLDGGQWADCAGSAHGNATSWFPYDTPATAGSRQPIAGDHPLHPTVAAVQGLICNTIVTLGCPKPDLLGTAPAPAPNVLPDLFDYSTDLGGAYAGGRRLQRDVACGSTPSADNAKSHMWVTSPLAQPMTLTGEGGVTLYSQTADAQLGAATVCVRFYDVPESILNLLAGPPEPLGTASYSLDEWPTEPSPVSFNFDFRSGDDTTVPAGHRIGARVWVAGSSDRDLALVYDHPSFSSSIQLNSL